MEKLSINRVKYYNLDAKKAYEFARGALYPKKGKLVYVYQRVDKKGQYKYPHVKKIEKTKLSPDEQEVFLDNPLYAFKYAKKVNTRLCQKVEDNFFNQVTDNNVPNVIYYCKLFGIPVPENFHNFAIVSAAFAGGDTKQKRIHHRKNKRYLEEFEKNKKICKKIINTFVENGWISKEDNIEKLLSNLDQ